MAFSALDNLLQQRQYDIANQANYDLPFGGTTQAEFDFLSKAGAVNTMAPNFMSFMAGVAGGNLATQQNRAMQYKAFGDLAKQDAALDQTRARTDYTGVQTDTLEAQLPYVDDKMVAGINGINARTGLTNMQAATVGEKLPYIAPQMQAELDNTQSTIDAREQALTNNQTTDQMNNQKVALQREHMAVLQRHQAGEITTEQANQQIALIRGRYMTPGKQGVVSGTVGKSGYTIPNFMAPEGQTPQGQNPVTPQPAQPTQTRDGQSYYDSLRQHPDTRPPQFLPPGASRVNPYTNQTPQQLEDFDKQLVALSQDQQRLKLFGFTPDDVQKARQVRIKLLTVGLEGLTAEEQTLLANVGAIFANQYRVNKIQGMPDTGVAP